MIWAEKILSNTRQSIAQEEVDWFLGPHGLLKFTFLCSFCLFACMLQLFSYFPILLINAFLMDKRVVFWFCLLVCFVFVFHFQIMPCFLRPSAGTFNNHWLCVCWMKSLNNECGHWMQLGWLLKQTGCCMNDTWNKPIAAGGGETLDHW